MSGSKLTVTFQVRDFGAKENSSRRASAQWSMRKARWNIRS